MLHRHTSELTFIKAWASALKNTAGSLVVLTSCRQTNWLRLSCIAGSCRNPFAFVTLWLRRPTLSSESFLHSEHVLAREPAWKITARVSRQLCADLIAGLALP